MDLQAQEKISKLMLLQAEKLGKAIQALKKAQKLLIVRLNDSALMEITGALKEIADHGKHPEDL